MEQLKSDKKNHITGQLFFRDTLSDSSVDAAGPGRKLMMVVGIIAVPEDTEIKGEHQYVVAGGNLDNNFIQLGLVTHKGVIDRTEAARGLTIGSLLTKEIWQV
jgi:hypothetical protein